jgi:fumarate hydratase class II
MFPPSTQPKEHDMPRTAARRRPDAAPSRTRTETDSMGSMTVPADVLYGATTQRAVLNFPVSGRPVPPQVIAAYLELKRACATANARLGVLPRDTSRAIVDACERLLEDFADRRGEVMRHFPIDVFQTGSGTSTNMNVNEVIANVASVSAGKAIGSKDPLHPNDHVNCGQSSNDTFPTAMQVAGAVAIHGRLIPSLAALAKSLRAKSRAWDGHVKIGRTHLMDATPIRVGQEFSGYAAAVELGLERATRARDVLAHNLPIGGTAVGTGINAHPKLGHTVSALLSKDLGIRFKEAGNHFEAQATRDCVVEASGMLRTIAVSLTKVANDIRWLGSGPRCGLGELVLPATQPGSSIMPGKVNPVICESVMMVSCRVIGNDATVATAGLGGVGSLLELNVAMPVIADALIDSIELLANACDMFRTKCIDGLELHADATRTVERSLMMVTSLAPVIGYDRAAQAAKDAYKSGETIREHVLRHKLVEPKQLDRLLNPADMTKPGGKGPGGG